MHQLLHSVRWFNHFWPQVLYKLIAKIAKAHTNASRSPEPLENSLDWINFGSERSIACALLDNGPRRGERPVAEAAQRTWNRGADEKREHIGGCPTRNTHLEEGELRTLAWLYAKFLHDPRIHGRPSESSESFQVTFV